MLLWLIFLTIKGILALKDITTKPILQGCHKEVVKEKL